jgi:hypothetical protein
MSALCRMSIPPGPGTAWSVNHHNSLIIGGGALEMIPCAIRRYATSES